MGLTVRVLRWLTLCSSVLEAACGSATGPLPRAACAVPNAPARIITTAVAIEPPIAVQQGITGSVTVHVRLDAHSSVQSAVVVRSPSDLLDAAAVTAAEQSSYQTAIADCVPVPSAITFEAQFPVVPLPPPGP